MQALTSLPENLAGRVLTCLFFRAAETRVPHGTMVEGTLRAGEGLDSARFRELKKKGRKTLL